MSDSSPSFSTPVSSSSSSSSSRKRCLSSPEFISELKRNRLVLATMDVESDPTLAHPTLGPADLKLLTDHLIGHFRDEIKIMVNTAVKESVKGLVESQTSNIITGVITGLKDEISQLRVENSELKKRILQLESSVDSQEQYSRRNCLRISGLVESERENTDNLVIEMSKALDTPLDINEIDRSHRVGKPRDGKARDIIVKFTSYRVRQRFYRARTGASEIQRYKRVFINEDLTRTRSNILYECRKLKKAGRVLGAWSSDGNILVKDRREKIHRINSADDLARFN